MRFKDENGNSFLIKDNENRFEKKEDVNISQYTVSDVVVDEKAVSYTHLSISLDGWTTATCSSLRGECGIASCGGQTEK